MNVGSRIFLASLLFPLVVGWPTVSMSAGGDLQWSRSVFGTGYANKRALALSPDGSAVYVLGTTTTMTGTPLGQWDMWLGKFSSNGDLLWSLTRDNANQKDDIGISIAVDKNSGAIYAMGYLAFTPSSGTTWVGRFDENVLAWSVSYTGITGNTSSLGGIAVDSFGDIYALDNYFYGGDRYAQVRKFNSSGNVLWTSTVVGFTGRDIYIDDSNVLRMACNWVSTVPGNFTEVAELRMDSSGNLLATYTFPDLGIDDVDAITADSMGNSYLGGGKQNIFPNWASWSFKTDALGNQAWEKFWNPYSGTREWSGIDLDRDGNLYVTGFEENPAGGNFHYMLQKLAEPGGAIMWSRSGNYNAAVDGDVIVDSDCGVYVVHREGALRLWLYKYDGGCVPLPPPAPPSNLMANDTCGSVNVAWDLSLSVTVTGYQVYRSTYSGGPKGLLTTLGASSTVYNDAGVSVGITYFYEITAMAGAIESVPTNESSAFHASCIMPPPSLLPPANALNLTALSSCDGIKLTWIKAMSNTKYFISKATFAGAFNDPKYLLVTLNETDTQYVDTNVTEGTTYFYSVVLMVEPVSATPIGAEIAVFHSKCEVVTPLQPIDLGQVKIVGGIRGYINPKRGEQAVILIRPKEAGEIRVRIYDMSGALVWQETLQAFGGRTEVIQWPGVNSTGQEVSPGIYPVFIEAPGIRYKDKLIVVR